MIRIFEVGGSIRNELMGLKAKDRDFSVLAPSYDAMKSHILENGGTIYQERPQFVSIKARFPELGDTDFTLARKESFYTDSRHPDSVSPAETIEDDLKRRDFTMNAIAREVGTTNLIDPFGGVLDIKDCFIRCVGNPKERFTEDRLRIFRAIRFAAVLEFDIRSATSQAIHSFREYSDYDSVKAEMIQIEMWKAFNVNTDKAFQLLVEYPFLLAVMVKKGLKLKPTLEK